MFDQILGSLGLKKLEDLNAEERRTLMTWTQVLSSKEVTLEDVRKVLPVELARARREAEKYENDEKRDLYFKAYCRLLEGISQIILTPVAQREQLRSYLKQRFPTIEI